MKEVLDDENLIGEKVLGALPVPPEQYPYMVSLRKLPHNHECSGALIAPAIVLTTAVCASLTAGGYAIVGGEGQSVRRC